MNALIILEPDSEELVRFEETEAEESDEER